MLQWYLGNDTPYNKTPLYFCCFSAVYRLLNMISQRSAVSSQTQTSCRSPALSATHSVQNLKSASLLNSMLCCGSAAGLFCCKNSETIFLSADSDVINPRYKFRISLFYHSEIKRFFYNLMNHRLEQ